MDGSRKTRSFFATSILDFRCKAKNSPTTSSVVGVKVSINHCCYFCRFSDFCNQVFDNLFHNLAIFCCVNYNLDPGLQNCSSGGSFPVYFRSSGCPSPFRISLNYEHISQCIVKSHPNAWANFFQSFIMWIFLHCSN